MLKTAHKIKAFVALFAITLGLSAAMPYMAAATPGNPAYCDADVPALTNKNIGTEVPVIMVHGWWSNSQIWGSINNTSSFAGEVNNIPGVAVAHLFDYNTNSWVDDPANGPMLAKTIDCVSRLSLQNGGKGKVIVVANSMGGMVARDALSRRSTDGRRAIADEAGQVVTIATPNAGIIPIAGVPPQIPYPVYQAFLPGSTQLANLPHFPQQTVVHAIAADVTRIYYDIRGQEQRREQPHDDTFVKVESALSDYSVDAVKGGASKIVTCDKTYIQLPFIGRYVDFAAVCEHGQLVNNSDLNGVRLDTVNSIKKYVAWLNTPPPVGVSLTIGELTTTYDSRWTDIAYGPSGAHTDGYATDTTNGTPCSDCGDPSIITYPFIQVFDLKMNCADRPLLDCATGSAPLAGAAPPVTIGGRTPTYSTRYIDSGRNSGSMVWCFDDTKICVYYRQGSEATQLQPSAALLDVFRTAQWQAR